jgi:hypothetical protein
MVTTSTSGDDPWKAQLAAMTPVQKVELWQRIWNDLAPLAESSPSPEWHRGIVEERLRMLDAGTVKVEDWEDVEHELDEFEP